MRGKMFAMARKSAFVFVCWRNVRHFRGSFPERMLRDMNEQGTIAAVLARLDFLERRVTELEATDNARRETAMLAARYLQAKRESEYQMQCAQNTNGQ
jgi:hypothetical protein